MTENDPSIGASITNRGQLGLGELLDNARVRHGHVTIVALLFLVLLVDGYDLGITGQILPTIAADFGVDTSSLTGAYAAQPIGQALGGLLLAPLADRFGRKRMLIILLIGFSVATLLSVFVSTVNGFMATRFLAGALGGGLLPAAASLVADISTLKRRSTLVGIVYAGIMVGSVLSSVLVAILLEHIGWHGMYVIGAITPLVLIAPILLLVPESPLYLARRSAAPDKIRNSLRKLNIELAPEARFHEPDGRTRKKISVVDIFADNRAAFTIVLWIACVCGQLSVAIFVLGATLFNEFEGVPVTHYASYASFAGLAAIAAGFSTGPVMDRFGRYQVIGAYGVMSALSLLAMGFAPFGSAAFVAAIVCAGFFSVGSFQGLNITTPIVYPPPLRSAAVGWKGSISRLGSSAAPIIAAMLMAQHTGLKVAMLVAAAPVILVVLLCPLLAKLERRMLTTSEALS